MIERKEHPELVEVSSLLEGLESLALGLELSRELRDAPSEAAKENLSHWLKSRAGVISPFDLQNHNGTELAQLLVDLPDIAVYTELFGNLVLNHSPSTILALGNMVREDDTPRAFELLVSTAQQEINHGTSRTASRVLATLAFTRHIDVSSLPQDVGSAVMTLASGINLLHRTQDRNETSFIKAGIDKLFSVGNESDAQRFIAFKVREGQSRDLADQRIIAERVCDNQKELTNSVSAIYKILSQPNATIEQQTAAYEKLLVIQEVICERLRSPNIEDALVIIFSTPGLMEELYAEFGRIELTSSNDIGMWLRAGLQNPYFREDCLKALVHAAVYGVEGSSLRSALFEAYQTNEVPFEEITEYAEKICGEGAADILQRQFDLHQTSIGAFGNSPLAFIAREKRPVDWIIRPSMDRVFDKAINDLETALQCSTCWPTMHNDAERCRERILSALVRMESHEGAELKSWANASGLPAAACNNLMQLGTLYIQHELIRIAMPISRVGKGINGVRQAMAQLHLASFAIKQEALILVPSLFRTLASDKATIYDQLLCNQIGSEIESTLGKNSGNVRPKDIVTYLSSLPDNQARQPYFQMVQLGFVKISEGQFNDVIFHKNPFGHLQILDDGKEVSSTAWQSLAVDSSYGPLSLKESIFSGQLFKVSPMSEAKPIPLHKSVEYNFCRVFADRNFDIHSAPQDTWVEGKVTYGSSWASLTGLIVGTDRDRQTDLLIEVVLGTEDKVYFHTELSALLSQFAGEQMNKNYADDSFYSHMDISHMFQPSPREKYFVFKMKNSDTYYLAPLRLFPARDGKTMALRIPDDMEVTC